MWIARLRPRALLIVWLSIVGAAMSESVSASPVSIQCGAYCPYQSQISERVIDATLRLYRDFGAAAGEPVVVYDYDQNLTHVFSAKLDRSPPSDRVVVTVLGQFISSGGRGGVGNRVRTGATPLGVHRIYRKQGSEFQLNQTFDAAKYGFFETVLKPTVGLDDWASDFVTTRILRLRGLEPLLNSNSDARKILFHGTPEEGLLGYHESAGCIRLGNSDVIRLFNLVQEGTLVHSIAEIGRPVRVPRHLLKPVDESKVPELRRRRSVQ